MNLKDEVKTQIKRKLLDGSERLEHLYGKLMAPVPYTMFRQIVRELTEAGEVMMVDDKITLTQPSNLEHFDLIFSNISTTQKKKYLADILNESSMKYILYAISGLWHLGLDDRKDFLESLKILKKAGEEAEAYIEVHEKLQKRRKD